MSEDERLINPYDRTDGKSVISLLPKIVRERVEEAVMKIPDLVGLHERDLVKKLRRLGKSPTPTDNRIRLCFWNEYDRAQETDERMVMERILHTTVQSDYFYNDYLYRPHKVIWLMCAPASYETLLEEMLQYGVEQVRDILEIPSIVDGKVDHKLALTKARLLKTLEQKRDGFKVSKPLPSGALELAVDNSNEAKARKLEELRKRELLSRNIQTFTPKEDEDEGD